MRTSETGSPIAVRSGPESGAADDRWVLPAFAILLVAAAAILFWEGRGTTYFNIDDLSQFYALSWSPAALLHPFNGHLILVSRLVFHAVSSLFGADYPLLRAIAVASVLAVDVVFFALARQLVRPAAALAAAIPVLFLGSAWEAILWPAGAYAWAPALAAGLGALLALRVGGRHRDLAVCGLLIVSLASFTVGLCFVVAVAVAVLMGEGRWRRAWVFAVPLGLWVAWWLWARRFGETQVVFANLPHLPGYYARSLAWVVGAVTGVSGIGAPGVSFNVAPAPKLNASPELAVAAVIGIGALLWRRRIPPELWPPLAALIAFWTLTGLASGLGRGPQSSRYMLAGVILLLLVALAAARGHSIGRGWLAALFAAAVTMAALNLLILQRAHDFFHAYSTNARAQLAMLELAGSKANPDFNPGAATPAASSEWVLLRTADYLAGVARYGSPAETLADVRGASTPIRQRADQVLAAATGLTLRVSRSPRPGIACRTIAGRSLRSSFGLPVSGALVRAAGGSGMALGRFASPSASAGLLGPGQWEALSLPSGRVGRGWSAAAPTARRLEVCPVPSSEAVDEAADRRQVAAGGLALSPARAPMRRTPCRTTGSRGGVTEVVPLPRGGALLRADAPAYAFVAHRALVATASVGLLGYRRWEELRLPRAGTPGAWALAAPGAARLTVCRLR
jgi:hypothetical protein